MNVPIVNVPILRGDKMRKSQKVYRFTNKQLCKNLMRFNNASLSEIQRKDIINKATNYGTSKTDNNTMYQLIKDTLIKDKPYKNMVHLGKQLEETERFYKTVYICSNLEKVQYEGLGIENQTNEERMSIKNELKYYKNTIDNFDRSKINQIK
tara:strand:+ start:84 stop:539 length:456 start_codon:yes stop_codon:yes gene_type:complete